MIDRMLDMGSMLDWISPLLSLLRPKRITLAIPSADAWAVQELEAHGIPTYWPQIVADSVVFDIDKGDLEIVLAILEGLGFDMR